MLDLECPLTGADLARTLVGVRLLTQYENGKTHLPAPSLVEKAAARGGTTLNSVNFRAAYQPRSIRHAKRSATLTSKRLATTGRFV